MGLSNEQIEQIYASKSGDKYKINGEIKGIFECVKSDCFAKDKIFFVDIWEVKNGIAWSLANDITMYSADLINLLDEYSINCFKKYGVKL